MVSTIFIGNEVVRMVGDRVNDVPSLKAVDISAILGSELDITIEAAGMTLLDLVFSATGPAIVSGCLLFFWKCMFERC